MSEDETYQDRVRRALGVPTTAEREAQAKEEALRKKALIDDQPRRQQLIAQFKSSIGLLLDQVFREIQPIAQEAGLDLTEANHVGGFGDVLLQRSFAATLKRNPVQGRMSAFMPHIPFLEFRLLTSGHVQVQAPVPQASSSPLLPVRFSPHTLQLQNVGMSHVQEAFTNYLVAVKEALKAR